MGSENLFHKRKAKLQKSIYRRKASRKPYQKVLIVCEGTVTEPIYFNGIKDHYEINTANIKVSGDCGSDPLSVVNHAIELYEQEKQTGDPYDRVYCVFDQDSYHLNDNNYQQALDKIRRINPSGIFYPTTSVPCFEYWYLLHFIYTTAQFFATGNLSVGDATINKLCEYWPEYTKSMENTFELLLHRLDFAKNNAVRSLAEAQSNGTDHPTTNVHDPVIFLQTIKDT